MASSGPCEICTLTQTHNHASISPLSFLQYNLTFCLSLCTLYEGTSTEGTIHFIYYSKQDEVDYLTSTVVLQDKLGKLAPKG